jgi:hypothetical protein
MIAPFGRSTADPRPTCAGPPERGRKQPTPSHHAHPKRDAFFLSQLRAAVPVAIRFEITVRAVAFETVARLVSFFLRAAPSYRAALRTVSAERSCALVRKCGRTRVEQKHSPVCMCVSVREWVRCGARPRRVRAPRMPARHPVARNDARLRAPRGSSATWGYWRVLTPAGPPISSTSARRFAKMPTVTTPGIWLKRVSISIGFAILRSCTSRMSLPLSVTNPSR